MCNHYHPLSTKTPKLLDAAFTRRRFLGQMAMVSAAASVPGFVHGTTSAFADTTMRVASKAGVPEERVLVVVQLSGGNDGLNTVVPFGDDAYYRARPQIGINAREVLTLGKRGVDGLGLHPSLGPIKQMIDAGQAAVINGVGYPNPNRSHFKAMDIWHSAEVEESKQRGRGWVGKAMDTAYPQDRNGNTPDGASMACVSLGSDAPMATLGKHIQPVSFQTPATFRWAGRDVHEVLSSQYDQLHEDAPPVDSDDPAAFVYRTACDAQVASDKVRKAVQGQAKTRFPRNPLSNQLEMVSKMIRADLPTRVYYVTLGGFDTHAQQAARHAQLMNQFGEAMKAFYDELAATGHADRVVSVAFSEFGRRLRQNASGGTDHGVAAPSFVFGPAVKPGMHGRYPSLTQLDQGDLIHSIDFRCLYADLLDNWMKIDSATALGKRYEPIGIIG